MYQFLILEGDCTKPNPTWVGRKMKAVYATSFPIRRNDFVNVECEHGYMLSTGGDSVTAQCNSSSQLELIVENSSTIECKGIEYTSKTFSNNTNIYFNGLFLN